MFAAEGARLVLNDLGTATDGRGSNASPVRELEAELRATGAEVCSDGGDLGDTATGERLVNLALDRYGQLDVVVNVAGILRDNHRSSQGWLARGSGLLVAPLVLVAAGAATWALPSQMQVIVGFFITVVLVAALQIFSGNSGIVSFAHVGFMGVGAYVAALTSIPASIKQSQLPGLPHWLATLELGFLPSVAVAVVVTASLGALLGGVLVRMREDAIAVATISVLFILYTVFRNWDQVTQGALGLYGIPRSTTVWWAVTSAAVAIGAALCFRASRVGLQLRASSADALAAQTLGAHVARLRWLAWVASVAVMGLGGAVWAHFNIAFGPSQFFLPLTLTLLAMVTIGGLQSVSGVVAGAMVVTAIGELMRRLEDRVSMPGLTQIAVALLILAVLTWRPMGLVGPIELHHRIGKGRRRT